MVVYKDIWLTFFLRSNLGKDFGIRGASGGGQISVILRGVWGYMKVKQTVMHLQIYKTHLLLMILDLNSQADIKMK